MSSLLLGALLALLGCEPKPQTAVPGHSPAIPSLQVEGPVFYAPLVKARAPIPAQVRQRSLSVVGLDAGTSETTSKKLDPLLDLDKYLCSEEADVAWLVGEYPEHKTAIRSALGRCIDPVVNHPQCVCTCFHGLQLLDSKQAVEAARGLTNATPPLDAMAKTVLRFPQEGQLEQYLIDKGLFRGRSPGDDRELVSANKEGSSISTGKLLLAQGRAQKEIFFSPMSEGGYTRLLEQMVPLAREDLAGLVFDEIPPARLTGWHEGYHTVYGWTQKTRYRILLNSDPMLQQDQMVGFLNSILRDLGKDKRFALASDACSPPLVVVGTVAEFSWLQREDLLVFDVPIHVPEEPDTDGWNLLDFGDL
ncbi:MAG: hypothetical protein HN348_22700 [Proteobacteria bacterium]|nr:hypothetical protein [Pseudomonadota bacterium]